MKEDKKKDAAAEPRPADEPEEKSATDMSAELKGLREEIAGLRTSLAGRADSVPGIDAAAGRREEPKLTKEALAKMSHAEIARLDWKEVRRVLSAG